MFPHAPQFLASICVSTQPAPHGSYPVAQSNAQLAAVHVAVPCTGLGHVVSQLPQWLAELEMSRQALPQLLRPAAQLALHAPFEHTRPAAQAWLHAPQFAGSLVVSMHWSAQLVRGAAQLSEHLPATQFALPPVGSGQWLPHVPQLSVSLLKSTHTLPHAA
jgi:hypothetical protein